MFERRLADRNEPSAYLRGDSGGDEERPGETSRRFGSDPEMNVQLVDAGAANAREKPLCTLEPNPADAARNHQHRL